MTTANTVTRLVVPPQNIPIVNTDGTVTTAWYRHFQDVAQLSLDIAQAVVQQEMLIEDVATVANTVATVQSQANSTSIGLQAVQTTVQQAEEAATAAKETTAASTTTVAEYIAIGS